MLTFVLTLGFFLIVVAAMAVGLALTGRALSGSCGGTGGACSCGPAKRAKCSKVDDGVPIVPNREVPIQVSALTRNGR